MPNKQTTKPQACHKAKRVIMVDVDDTICTNHFLPLVNKYLGTNYEIDNFKTYNILEDSFKTLDELNKFTDYFLQHNSYAPEYTELFQSAYDALKKINETDDLYLLTAFVHDFRQKDFARQITDKFNFLVDALPFFDAKKIIFSNRKHIVKADVIIDDKLKHLAAASQKKILFDAWHNRSITDAELKEAGVVRAKNWAEILEILGV